MPRVDKTPITIISILPLLITNCDRLHTQTCSGSSFEWVWSGIVALS